MPRPYSFRPKITPDRLAALAVSLLPLLYFYPATAGPLVLCPDDGAIFNAPLRVAAARIMLGGSLPLWNPYLFSGMPLLAAAQGGILFPLNWFFLVFNAPTAANLTALSTYALAGLGAYRYARRSGAEIAGACLTGLVFQFSGFMVAQVGHTNIIQTAALVPWVLWAVDGFGQEGGRARGVAVAALVALQVFAGHQQTLAYSILVASAYAIFRALAGAREHRRRYLGSLALIVAGLLLAAVQILPTYELLGNSVRASASYDFFTSFSMPRRFFWTLFAPYVVGGGDGALFRAPYTGPAFYAEYIGYVGLLTLALAALALLLRRERVDLFWAGVALVALALALGRFLPLDIYKIVYHVPVLNLFRVPARHLLEFDFALAVLAGRGLSALMSARGRARAMVLAASVSACVFLLTWLAVTAGRPNEFKLGRRAPVSILRAPELFMPLVVAILSVWALWAFARRRRGSSVLLFAVLAFDLVLWGHSSGWRRGPTEGDALWREPSTVRLLRERHGSDEGQYRILTVPQAFEPQTQAAADAGAAFVPELQPNIYMMHGVENAAGYDGFGLGRYSSLAGEMKVWGELAEPQRTLSGDDRAFDLLNVRYLLARNPLAPEETFAADAQPAGPPQPTQSFGGYAFAVEDLKAPQLDRGKRLVFRVPKTRADTIALITNLSWSLDVADGTTVGRVRLLSDDGREFELELRAGEHTSEWAYDREDVRARARHRRAPVATSFPVEDAHTRYEGHTYVAALALPEGATITGGEIEVASVGGAPDLILDVKRLSLISEGRAFPLRLGQVKRAAPRADTQATKGTPAVEERWRRVAEEGRVVIYENTRALPRAWLATEVVGLTDAAALQTIRTGRLPDGRAWDSRRTVLASLPQNNKVSLPSKENRGEATVTRHEPNRVEVSVSNETAAVLVLSENFYPGWRASVDGREAEILRVNYNLRGVVVGPGEHRVSFVYSPRSVWLGGLVSLLTLAGLMMWCFRWPRLSFTRRKAQGLTHV